MKKLFFFLSIFLLATTTLAQNNVIYYTSSDGNIVKPNKSDAFNAKIISNTYENEQGAIILMAT